MRSKNFGPTNKKIYCVGLGTYGHGDAYGGITQEESLEILHSAVATLPKDANFLIDTAPRYGNGIVETWIGKFLNENKNDNVLIATKGGRHIEPGRVNEKDFSAEFLRADLDESLKRLGVDNVFLYQLHNPPLSTISEGSVFAVLEKMRNEGKIQWYGVSIDTAEEGLAAINVCRERGYKGLASLQLIYNILQKNVLDEFCKSATESGIAIIAREPLLRGFLTDLYIGEIELAELAPAPKKTVESHGINEVTSGVKKIRQLLMAHQNQTTLAQLALQFVVSNPCITVVIPGINRKEFITDDLSIDNTNINPLLIQQLKRIDNIKGIDG